MTDNLSQDELDKLLAGVTGDDAGDTGEDEGLTNDEFAKLETLFSGGWTKLAGNMSQSLGAEVAIDFGVAANLPVDSLSSDLEALGVLLHFPVKAMGEAPHAIILQADEVAKLGALIGGGEAAGATLTAGILQEVVDFLEMSLPIVFTALQEAMGEPAAIGAVQSIDATDPGTEFDPDTLGLGAAVVRLEYALTVGDVVTCPMLYTLPLDHARALISTMRDLPAAAGGTAADPQRPTFAEFDSIQGQSAPGLPPSENLDIILDIQLQVVARLGSIQMPIREILKLGPGSIIDIDRPADAPVDLVVNEKLVAHGDMVVVQENFGLKISDVLSPQERIASLRP